MTTNSELLHLATDVWQLEVQPARGGAVTALRHRGRAVLVSPDLSTADAMGAASFVLVPYANRIARGRVEFGDAHCTLPRNFGEHAHPLHGIGWKRPWSVTAVQADVVAMRLQHHADAHWPWSFSARQRIALLPDAVRFELAVTNDASVPAPMGLGFHPAFAANPRTTLHTQLAGVWLTDDDLPLSLVPAQQVLAELPGAVPVGRRVLVDHCFTDWSRELRIDDTGSDGAIVAVELTASPGMNFLQLYMPPGKPWFCAEPMSQMPDAIHHRSAADSGLRLLAPGESMCVWMQIAVRDSGRGNLS